jgi:type IV pilus assembly protein PilQ
MLSLITLNTTGLNQTRYNQVMVQIRSIFFYGVMLWFALLTMPESWANQASNDEGVYRDSGERMTLNFTDISTRLVLQKLADISGKNIVVSDSVTGNMSLRLDQVTWLQALDAISVAKGLGYKTIGNIIFIETVPVVKENQMTSAVNLSDSSNGQAESVPANRLFETEVIALHYASASDLAALLHTESSVLFSEGGSMLADERTNRLIIVETREKIALIKQMVEALDVPAKQVLIEARIVMVNEGELDEMGVRWGIFSAHDTASVAGSLEENLASIGVVAADDLTVSDLLNVNLAASSTSASSIAFQLAKLGANTLIDLELSALQSESKAEIISSPRLLTTNQKPAFIEQGTEIPYLEMVKDGTSTIAFKKAVLSLEVTPQITPDNQLLLDLQVTQDRPGEVVKTGNGEAVAIVTQRIGTQVSVGDGETIVLGGIYQQSSTEGVDKVPVLGDVPLLGALFRRSYQRAGKTELVIFITPKVIIQ